MKRSFQLPMRPRSLSDPFESKLRPPDNESPIERTARLEREIIAKKVSDDIDEQIRLDRAEQRRQKDSVKVLLLGQSESGKSTTLKQFQLLHAYKEFSAERSSWRAVIYLNLIRSVRRILEALLPPDSAQTFLSIPTLSQHPPNDGVDSFFHFDGPSISSSSRQTSGKFERYAQYLMPLLELEQRLIRQLSFPEEDDDPPLRDDITVGRLPDLLLPASAFGRRLPNTRSGELALRPTSKWKEAFSFKAAADRQKTRNDYTGEVRGWWEDPNDPVHILHACAEGQYGIRALWQDSAVRMTLTKRRVRMEESAGFYLDDVSRITALKYIPTDDDVLRARLKTLGVMEHSFRIKAGGPTGKKEVEWRIYDVGGARPQRQAWAPYFDDVNAIIFLAPISAFDQTLAEDPRVNRLEDSMLLWKSVVSNKLLENVNIILFLNKCDLLKAKLETGVSLAYHMVSYGSRSNDYDAVSQYFKNKFKALHYSFTPNRRRELFIHLTSVTDKNKTAYIISSVRDLILRQNLQDSRLM